MNKKIKQFMALRDNADFENTLATIKEGVSLKGYNMWILLCSTMLACIGLDTNSTAVIIGAMLISPLMNPILGVGFSVAINDRELLLKSLRDLFLAILISLSGSVLYFLVSPLGNPTPELQARTFPTLLDVLVALFGGIAGIVSISRRISTNAIPGVAIATALMPPLCTAGFGIATLRPDYFGGAFYLFFINAVFISLATWFISRYLHFPVNVFVDRRTERNYHILAGLLSIIVLVPSSFFLYTLYKKQKEKKNIESLVIIPIENLGNEIIKWEIDKKDSITNIKIYHSGKQLNDSIKLAIDSSLQANHLNNYHLSPIRINLTKDEVSQLSAETTRQMFQEMHIEELVGTMNYKNKDSLSFKNIFNEAEIAFPFIDTIYTGYLFVQREGNKKDTLPTAIYKLKRPVGKADFERMKNYLKQRMETDTVVLISK